MGMMANRGKVALGLEEGGKGVAVH